MEASVGVVGQHYCTSHEKGRGYLIARVDMGWEGDWRIAVEYDGDHHRTDERQFARDIARVEALEAAGWIVIRVTAKDRPADVLRRIRAAIARRA